MPTRGVLYVKWGTRNDAILDRSLQSLKKIHPELPVHVQTLPQDSTLLDKARMMQFTPFQETLYLDTDTVVLDNLSYGFEKALRYGLALSICECPCARRYTGLKSAGDLIEYNTGVMFFTLQAKPVFDHWCELAPVLDSSIDFISEGRLCRMERNDQGSFAKSIDDVGYHPWVLPLNWNFRPLWQQSAVFGPVKIWHAYDEVPPMIYGWNENQAAPDSVIRCSAG